MKIKLNGNGEVSVRKTQQKVTYWAPPPVSDPATSMPEVIVLEDVPSIPDAGYVIIKQEEKKQNKRSRK